MTQQLTPKYLLKEMKIYLHIKTCAQMFPEALCVTDKTRNNPSAHQQVNERINKL